MNWFTKTAATVEADVLAFIQKAESDAQVVIADAEKAISWVASKAPEIASDMQMVEGFVVANPALVANPAVLASVTAANLAVQGLNAFATSYNAANTTAADKAKAVVAGYKAVKDAQSAAAGAASLAVSHTKAASK